MLENKWTNSRSTVINAKIASVRRNDRGSKPSPTILIDTTLCDLHNPPTFLTLPWYDTPYTLLETELQTELSFLSNPQTNFSQPLDIVNQIISFT
jgi:hypothetical protein